MRTLKAKAPRRFVARAVAVVLLVALLGSCAVFNRKNRRLTNELDERIQPKSTVTKVLLFPVIVPVGFVALVSDMALVHPIRSVPKAAEDTYELLWENPSGGLAQQSFLLIPKIVLSPVLFLGDLIVRSLFDVD